MHNICFVRFGTGVPEFCAFLNLKLVIHIEKVCVSNFFNSLQVIFKKKYHSFLISFDKMGVYSSQSVIVLYLIDSYG